MSGQDFFELFGLLVFAHMLGDYPLQGEFLAKAKNRFAPLCGVPWYQALAAHSLIHGGLVGIVTGSIWLGLAETLLHAWIDDLKCRNRIGYNLDQALHLLCKLLWVGLMATGLPVFATP